MIEDAIEHVRAGGNLSRVQMFAAMNRIMSGDCPADQLATFLLGLNEKGPVVDEVVGAAQSLRQHMTRIKSRHAALLDTCGTGGDGANTFNISTAAAFVIAAAGVPVAKHGNRSITSKSGSSDVLERLGVNIQAGVPQVEVCLDRLGICFCFAPLLHRSMQYVAEVRRSLGVPTIFNLLGPLCNPAGAPFQLLGVGRPGVQRLMAEALRVLGTRRALVVRGEDGLDEVTLSGETRVFQASTFGVVETTWRPEDFGLEPCPLDSLRVDGPEASAARIRAVLEGQPGPARDIVVMNAAAAIAAFEGHERFREAAAKASAALDRGQALQVLRNLADWSHRKVEAPSA